MRGDIKYFCLSVIPELTFKFNFIPGKILKLIILVNCVYNFIGMNRHNEE